MVATAGQSTSMSRRLRPDDDCNGVNRMPLSAGDWVEIRSKSEILQTLDSRGRLAEMPFMPEMFKFCGQRHRVVARAHKTCDPIYTIASRSLSDAVHLSLRCDGSAHGGCQTGCLLFWNEAWLKRVAPSDQSPEPAPAEATPAAPARRAACSEAQVLQAAGNETRYVCQTTELNEFTKPLPWWRPGQYVEDYASGNVSLRRILHGAVYVFLGRRFGRKLPVLRRIHDVVQSALGGPPTPVRNGTLPKGSKWPMAPLNLKAGDLVRVKSHEAILATIDESNHHRGLLFDVELVPFCGKVFRVRSLVERFVDEKTGKIRSLKTPAVILENVWCQSQFSKCRMHCPRRLYSWWREEWLERADEAALATTTQSAGKLTPATPARSEKPELVAAAVAIDDRNPQPGVA